MRKVARPWLLPFNPLYRAAVAVRELRIQRGWEQVQRLNWPVISVGNLSTGGAGKTPLTIELAQLLTAAGVSVDILSRGYGRKNNFAVRVNPEGSAEEFGDEPLLIAQATGLPVYVARHRFEAGVEAELEASIEAQSTATNNALQIHLLDDGFQHRQLYRSIDILLLSRRDWEDCLLPAGNLREWKRALLRADVVVIPAEEMTNTRKSAVSIFSFPAYSASYAKREGIPIKTLEEELCEFGFQGEVWGIYRGMKVSQAVASCNTVAAFCGIAYPEQFFEGIEAAGNRIAVKFTFKDHHTYTVVELKEIAKVSVEAGANVLLTTEKDLARLGAQRQVLEAALPMAAVELRTEILEAEKALSWIFERLRGQG